MLDTLDLTPPQRTPVIRGTTAGRATPGGAEQSSTLIWLVPFEGGVEQSYIWPALPFEEGAEQSWSIYVVAPFE
jgi:hypothetical protein